MINKWQLVTDGNKYAIRRRSYFFALWWVYKSRRCPQHNWSDIKNINQACWGTKEEIEVIYYRIYPKKINEEQKDGN